jgi:glucose-6-phosphate isomerase
MAAHAEAIVKKKKSRPNAWKDLGSHYKQVRELHLRELFANDPNRGTRLTAEAVGLYLDYSKNRITDETVRLLIQAGGGIGPAGTN